MCAAGLLLPQSASASERRFGYTYPTQTSAKGEVELENWVTWKSRPGEIRTFEFRHELEIGLTQNTQLGLYPGNWMRDQRSRKSFFGGAAVELIHNLSNPVTDWVGSAVYGEFSMGERSAALEGKLLLEKRIGNWVIGWNGILESEWEGDRFGDFQESSGEIAQTFGISYDLSKQWSVGAEFVHQLSLQKWSAPANPELYVGPNVTFRKGRFFSTMTALFQVTDRRDEPSVQTRVIVGVDF